MNDNAPPARRDETPRVAWLALACAVAALLLGLVALFVALGADDEDAPSGSGGTPAATAPPSSTAATTPPATPSPTTDTPTSETTTTEIATETTAITTTAPIDTITTTPTSTGATTTPTTPVLPTTTMSEVVSSEEVSPAIWPQPGSDLSFSDPVAAAESFAVDFVGFDEVVVGEFLAGDSRSGEVEIRPRPTGLPTVVHVRQLDGNAWAVVGASNANITVEQPATLTEIASPMVLVGEARAFEGTVQVRLFSDGSAEPVVTGFVTGSGGPEPGPFAEVFAWNTVTSPGATLLLYWTSPADGSIEEATAVRLRFHDVPV